MALKRPPNRCSVCARPLIVTTVAAFKALAPDGAEHEIFGRTATLKYCQSCDCQPGSLSDAERRLLEGGAAA